MVNDLSYSISANVGTIQGNSPGAGLGPNYNPDQHTVGNMVTPLMDGLFFAAFGACLLELVQQLKQKGIWADTVIDVWGEFNRSPRNNGSGSDHGFRGASCMLYSGALNNGRDNPIILGNIQADSGDRNRAGTWGVGAPNPELNDQVLNVGHLANTIATLLRTPLPVTAATSLLRELPNGTYEPILAEGTIVS